MNFCFVHRILILITIAPSASDEVVAKGSIGEIAIYFLGNRIGNAVVGIVEEKRKIKNPRNLGVGKKELRTIIAYILILLSVNRIRHENF